MLVFFRGVGGQSPRVTLGEPLYSNAAGYDKIRIIIELSVYKRCRDPYNRYQYNIETKTIYIMTLKYKGKKCTYSFIAPTHHHTRLKVCRTELVQPTYR